ncbi:MAG: hypothetical protein PHI63_05835 [Patescibacteria group bacterium]|nr:hypothetical protein [Patescibacteria group bacterium]
MGLLEGKTIAGTLTIEWPEGRRHFVVKITPQGKLHTSAHQLLLYFRGSRVVTRGESEYFEFEREFDTPVIDVEAYVRMIANIITTRIYEIALEDEREFALSIGRPERMNLFGKPRVKWTLTT